MRHSVIPLLLATLGLAGTAWSAGFQVDTQSARPTGMATAVTGGIDDSSAILYNPAGIANGKELDAQIGITPIYPSNTYTPVGGGTSTNTTTGAVVPPTIYASTALVKPLAFGIGLYSLYGLAIDWPNGWAGQDLVTHIQLTTFTINPTVAISLSKAFRLAAGLDIVRGTVQLNRNIPFPGSQGSVELGGGAWGTGFNAGLQVDIVPGVLSAGLTYRGTVTLPFTGNAHFSNIPPSFQSEPALQDQAVATTIVLPQSSQLGITVHPMKELQIGADLVYTGWQSVGSLDIYFANDPVPQSQPRNWTHTFNYHLGAEWAPDDSWRIRLGGMYDPTPIPASTLSPDLPDSNRVNLAAGLGYRIKGFTFDVAYTAVIFSNTTSTLPTFPAQYNGLANLFGITVGYQSPPPKPETAAAEPAPPPPEAAPQPPPTTPPAPPPPAAN
jgi:long-chain fatty acid transport protein